jgi:hypothetical protein
MSITQPLQNLFEEASVYKTWILCSDDAEAETIRSELEQLDHAVSVIWSSMVEDERLPYVHPLHDFCDHRSRILVTPYYVWSSIQEELETQVLPEQNVIAFGSLEDEVVAYVMRQVRDAHQRGFFHHRHNNHVLLLANKQNLA